MNDGAVIKQDLQELRDEISRQFTAMTELVTAGFATMNERFDRLESRVDSLEARMEHLEARMEQFESQLKDVAIRVGALEVGQREMNVRLAARRLGILVD